MRVASATVRTAVSRPSSTRTSFSPADASRTTVDGRSAMVAVAGVAVLADERRAVPFRGRLHARHPLAERRQPRERALHAPGPFLRGLLQASRVLWRDQHRQGPMIAL